MKIKSLSLLLASLFPVFTYAADIEVARYVVGFPAGNASPIRGVRQEFPQGLPVGIGSGLTFNSKRGDDLVLTTLTDRGPNADALRWASKKPKFRQPTIRASVDGHSYRRRQGRGRECTALA